MFYRLISLCILLILLSACGNVSTKSTLTPITTTNETQVPVEILDSLAYAEDDLKQKLDVYLPPEGKGPYPTILAIHGGGFRARSKSLYAEIGPYFARQGYAFVAMNYRLAPAFSYPAQVEDSFCALAWLHANQAEYGFDPNRAVVWGGSAGGYLASMLGIVKNPNIYLGDCPNDYPSGKTVKAAVIFYGFYDFTTIDDFPAREIDLLESFWGAEHSELPAALLVEMSPIMQIDGSEPPFIILHGTADNSIPSVMSERFAESLVQAGVDVELFLLPDAGHAFELRPLSGEEMSFSLGKIQTFLDRVLVP